MGEGFEPPAHPFEYASVFKTDAIVHFCHPTLYILAILTGLEPAFNFLDREAFLTKLNYRTFVILVDLKGVEPSNLLLAKQLLSQLSYKPISYFNFWWRQVGFEPTSSTLQV
jgi:hypothetical protein